MEYINRKWKQCFSIIIESDNHDSCLEVSKPIKTNLITLENYMKIKNIEIVDLLKIDTEGYEYEVLMGLKDKISNIKIIIFEHHYDNMIKKNYTYTDINKLLIENNFEKIFKAKMPLRKTFEYIFINKGS